MEEQLPKWFLWLNIALEIVAKFGGVAVLLGLAHKGLSWLDSKVQKALEEAEKKTDEFKLLKHTKVDNELWETLRQLSFTTFKTVKQGLKEALKDNKISQKEYRDLLHKDVKENFKKAVSKGKKEVFEAAYEDIDAVIDAMLPGVVKSEKDKARLEAKVLSEGGAEGNS